MQAENNSALHKKGVVKMSFSKGSLGWMYYEMPFGYVLTGAYDPYYWGYSPYFSTRSYFSHGIEKGNSKASSKKIKGPL